MFARLLLLRCRALLRLLVLVALAALLFGGGFVQAVAIAAPYCEEDVVLLFLSSEEAHGLLATLRMASVIIYQYTMLACSWVVVTIEETCSCSFTLAGMRFCFGDGEVIEQMNNTKISIR